MLYKKKEKKKTKRYTMRFKFAHSFYTKFQLPLDNFSRYLIWTIYSYFTSLLEDRLERTLSQFRIVISFDLDRHVLSFAIWGLLCKSQRPINEASSKVTLINREVFVIGEQTLFLKLTLQFTIIVIFLRRTNILKIRIHVQYVYWC